MLDKTAISFFESNFFDLYWKYIATGLAVYVCARLTYNLYHAKERIVQKNASMDLYNIDNRSNEELCSVQDEISCVPLQFEKLPTKETLERSEEFYRFMDLRRSVHDFSKETVPVEVITNIIKTAGTAPSGGNAQPWTYAAVRSEEIKSKIRQIVEKEDGINYMRYFKKDLKSDTKEIEKTCLKEYLTEAPYLILVFKHINDFGQNGKKTFQYYNDLSVSLSVGMLLTAIHYAGLVSVTCTPLNCGSSIGNLLGRPTTEQLILILPVGYPTADCLVPDVDRKTLEEIYVEY